MDHTGVFVHRRKAKGTEAEFSNRCDPPPNDVNIARELSQVTHERVLIKSKLNRATTTQTVPDSNGERIFHPRYVLTINDRNKFSFVVMNAELPTSNAT